MTAPQPEPISLDVTTMDPGEFARIAISRAVSGNNMAQAETHWDVATRYPRNADLVNVLVGIIVQLLEEVAHPLATTAAELWQAQLLAEAEGVAE